MSITTIPRADYDPADCLGVPTVTPVRCTVQPADARDFAIRTLAALIRQGGPSRHADGCRYRGKDGRACAAGMWLPDDVYNPVMEGHNLRSPVVMEPLMAPGAAPNPLYLHHFTAQALQFTHDRASSAGRDWFDTLHNEWVITAPRHCQFTATQAETIWDLAVELSTSGDL